MTDFEELKAKYALESVDPAAGEAAADEADEGLPCARGGVVDGETVDDGGVVQDNAQPDSDADNFSVSDGGTAAFRRGDYQSPASPEEAPVIPSEAPEAPVILSGAPEPPVILSGAAKAAESKDLTPPEDILSEAKNLTSDSSPASPEEAPVIPSEAPEAPVVLSGAAKAAESKDLTPPEDILSEAKNLTSDSSHGSEYQEATRDSSPEGLGMTNTSLPPETKPRKKRFWKIYAICTAIFVMLICGLLGFFWQFLKEYEQTRPINVAKETVTALAAGENPEGAVPPEANKYDCGADVAALFGAAGGTADAEIVEKVGFSTEDVPVFSVREGGKEICSVRLRRNGKHRFFDDWTADGVFFPGKHEVDITVTDDTTLLLNGVQVSEECVVSRDVPLPGYEDYAEYTPKCVHYKIENLLYDPALTFENDYCYPQATEKNGVWTVTYPGAKESRDDAVALAYEAAKAYVTYASSPDSPLAPLDVYLVQGSMLRARVLSFNRKYFTYHDSAEFKNMEVLDFSVYGADVFSVKLSFDYVMQTGRKEKVEKTVMTLYMLRIDGQWKIAEVASE